MHVIPDLYNCIKRHESLLRKIYQISSIGRIRLKTAGLTGATIPDGTLVFCEGYDERLASNGISKYYCSDHSGSIVQTDVLR